MFFSGDDYSRELTGQELNWMICLLPFFHFFLFLLFHTLVKPYIFLNNLNFAVISVKSIMDILNICKITKRFTFANKLGRETNFSQGFVLGSPAWELYHVLFWWQQKNQLVNRSTDWFVCLLSLYFFSFLLFIPSYWNAVLLLWYCSVLWYLFWCLFSALSKKESKVI